MKQMSKPSTQNLNLIANPEDLRKLCKVISAIEAIISPEWENRCYSYQKDWSESEEFCEMRNGQGDQMLILFSNDGICINGFAHESEMNGWENIQVEKKKSFMDKFFGSKKESKTELIQEIPNGVVTGLPKAFNQFIYGEPVKSIGNDGIYGFFHESKIVSIGCYKILRGDVGFVGIYTHPKFRGTGFSYEVVKEC